VGCQDCHDLSKPTNAKTLNQACKECHGDTKRFNGIVKRWQNESEKLFSQAEPHAGQKDKAVLDALRAAGPLHNMDATRKILKALAARHSGQSAETRQASP
jgi:hypothetical protein